MGFIFTLIGIITASRLWATYKAIAVLVFSVTAYQLFSLIYMYKKRKSDKKENDSIIYMNIISSLTIVISLIFSFFL